MSAQSIQASAAQAQLRRLLMGFTISRAVQVAAELGIADLLAAGPQPCGTLAEKAGAHAPTLQRLLRVLASRGVFEQLPDGRYANTEMSALLRAAVPGSLRALARMYAHPVLWQAWAGLDDSVRDGGASFPKVHGAGMFDYLARDPEAARRFDEAMSESSAVLNAAIVAAYDWSALGSLVDVGGGTGSTLAAILEANPRMHGVLFDLAHVTERGREDLAQRGLGERCRIQSGSFFDAIPQGADGYFMKHILHDWGDDDCARILERCASAMTPRSRLLVCEKLIVAGNAPSLAKDSDLVMLVLTPGGLERTAADFEALFARAGLRLLRVVETGIENRILEVARA